MIKLAHIKCESCRKAGHCVRTGECCHIREDISLSAAEEKSIKAQVYRTLGVIYLYPMKRYTISLTENEKDWMEAEAKKRNLKFKVLPKRVFYDEASNKAFVYDWFVDHDVCPFLRNGNDCSIYQNRPLICKDFPFHHLERDQMTGIKTFISDHSLKIPSASYQVIVRKARESLAKQKIAV